MTHEMRFGRDVSDQALFLGFVARLVERGRLRQEDADRTEAPPCCRRRCEFARLLLRATPVAPPRRDGDAPMFGNKLWLLLGQTAVNRGLLTPAQLEEALRVQEREPSPAPLGVILAEGGWLSHCQVEELLSAQREALAADPENRDGSTWRAWRFGALAIRLLRASPEAVNRALQEQARRHQADGAWKALGDILVDQGGLTPESVAELLAIQVQEGRAVTLLPTILEGSTRVGPEIGGEIATRLGSSGSHSEHAAERPGSAGPRRSFGKYELLEELGRGGMGVVVRAFDRELRREVALKTLPAGLSDDAEAVERLLREARTAATLDHPGIVPIHDVGVVDGAPYFAMAYVRGRTLAQALAGGGLAGVRERVEIVRQAAEATAYAHAHRVVHRDLKPSNLLIDETGRVLVLDFGLARRLDERTRLTATGQVLGTPQYMAPEQIEGEWEEIGPPADVYALGAVLYEVLTGDVPFPGATLAEVFWKVLRQDPRPPRERDARIARDLETICLTALAKEPGRRYASARELADDLGRYRSGEAIQARPESGWGRVMRWGRRRQGLVWITVVALAALGMAAVATSRARSLERERAHEEVRRREAEAAQARLVEDVLEGLRSIAWTNLKAALRLRRSGEKMSEVAPEFLPPLEAAVRKAVAQAPHLAEPHYHLGRMYRALMRFAEAKDEQDKALAKEPDYAPSLYERATYWAAEYRRRLATLRDEWLQREGQRLAQAGALAQGGLVGEKMQPVPPDDELARGDEQAEKLRAGLRADLERFDRQAGLGRRIASAGKRGGLTAGMVACARGMLKMSGAKTQADRDEAREPFTNALADEPGLEEAVAGLANMLEASGRYADAVSVYDRAVAADLGYVPFWTGRGDVRTNWGVFKMNRGEEPGPDYADALADYGKALELNPASAEAWMRRGGVRTNWGNFKMNRGEDPGAIYADALADFDRAVALDPGSAEARWHRGRLFHAMRRWAAAIADFEAAFKIDPSCEPNFRAQLAEARRNLHAAAPPQPAPAWLAALAAGDRAVQSGDYAAAGMAYTDALAAAQTALDALPAPDRIRLLADAAVRQALLNAHYNLACVLSLQSAGRSGPAAPPAPAPADAAGLRDQALEHLRAALDLGWNDAAHLQDDADLAPLHDDPRWAELLGSSEKPGK